MTPGELRDAVAELGISQRRLAEILDIGDRTVRHYVAAKLSDTPHSRAVDSIPTRT